MILHTTSEVISFARDMENTAAAFYRAAAAKYKPGQDRFSALAVENQKFITQIERAYYGVISDAFEGCFAFNLDASRYVIQTGLSDDATLQQVFDRAVKIEEILEHFYREAAEQSKSLMADVPRSFTLVANRRKNRISSLLASE